jgi:hypothetical protein
MPQKKASKSLTNRNCPVCKKIKTRLKKQVAYLRVKLLNGYDSRWMWQQAGYREVLAYMKILEKEAYREITKPKKPSVKRKAPRK